MFAHGSGVRLPGGHAAGHVLVATTKKAPTEVSAFFVVTYCIENWNTLISDIKHWSVTLVNLGFMKNQAFYA